MVKGLDKSPNQCYNDYRKKEVMTMMNLILVMDNNEKASAVLDKNTGEVIAEGRDNVNALVEAYGDNCTIEIW